MVSLQAHTSAVIDALRAAGLTVGDGIGSRWQDGGWQPLSVPYVVLYAIPGGDRRGVLSDPWADAELVYQATSVHTGPDGARHQADRVEEVLVGAPAPFTVPGRSLPSCRPDPGGSEGRDDDTAGPPLFYVATRFRLKTTPA